MNRTNEIIQFAKNLKSTYGTKNPFELCRIFGIEVLQKEQAHKSFIAHTIKFPNYPTVITINGKLAYASQLALCAHELGHALLHNDGINHFATTPQNAFTNVEYEADLFAVALLFNENDFNIPISNMSNYTLKSILDYNICSKMD